MSASATRLPIRKYKLRFIQSMLKLERLLQSGNHAKREGAGLLIVGNVAFGSRFILVKHIRAALQLLQHGVSDALVSVSLTRNILQTHRAKGNGKGGDFVGVSFGLSPAGCGS